MTESEVRSKFVDAAAGYLGVKEGGQRHREIIALYNSCLPHPRGYALKLTDPWCAGFVSAMAVKCGLTDIIPVECSCTRMIGLFKGLGRWQEGDDYVPKPGDILFYDWQDSGNGDNSGTPDHVGIVRDVSGGVILVIEGNYRNGVGCREVRLNGKYIRGFGVPDFASRASSRTYTVRKGDTLWAIARRKLGDSRRYPEIMKCNGLESDLIHPGQLLTLPES